MSVAIVPTGTANIASVTAAFTRAGVTTSIVEEVTEVAAASRVVVPGVGSFGSATESLDTAGFRQPLVERISDGRPTLLICVGMQLLAAGSEESPGARGLGIFADQLGQFSTELPVPQLGWNQVVPSENSRFVTPGWAYFANSFRLDTAPAGWLGASAEYGGSFVAAIEKGDMLACQFHPELSGRWGAALLERWLLATEEANP